MFVYHYPSFAELIREIRARLVTADIVESGEWQAKQGAPQGTMAELQDVSFSTPIKLSGPSWSDCIRPNLPWAEEHFQERVSGEPLNPPPSHVRWPFAVQQNAAHKDEKFSHTYPERLWPRHAGEAANSTPHRGIRFTYGDLRDVVWLLTHRPNTRQAYIPIWFPEDGSAARDGERVPCTLGYHVMHRRGKLDIRYYIRSCDFLRHFRDDVYMAGRLCQWLCEQVQLGWVPGDLVMHISSLHVFAPSDVKRLRSIIAQDQ